MYRYSADNSTTYTAADLILFKESVFACWMERLTLENPEHGIPPDVGSVPPTSAVQPQPIIAGTLRAEGKQVSEVPWELSERERRRATIDAMRQGIDFIVDGQLALGALSSPVNLLMRTSGYSDLGKYLYIPCDTQGESSADTAFSLCFLADLLQGLQGQLPPQMLLIQGGANVSPLKTEDHIYYFRAVKQRFLAAMRDFQPQQMPDPSESAHFGRWYQCANEAIRQQALARAEQGEALAEAEPAVSAVAVVATATDTVAANSASLTLAEQARQLEAAMPEESRDGAAQGRTALDPGDDALQNLEFIGSGRRSIPERSRAELQPRTSRRQRASDPFVEAERSGAPPPALQNVISTPSSTPKAHPLDSVGFSLSDGNSDPAVGSTDEPAAAQQIPVSAAPREHQPEFAHSAARATTDADSLPVAPRKRHGIPFSSSLMTSEGLFELGADPLRKG